MTKKQEQDMKAEKARQDKEENQAKKEKMHEKAEKSHRVPHVGKHDRPFAEKPGYVT
jgi:hypothetical protein